MSRAKAAAEEKAAKAREAKAAAEALERAARSVTAKATAEATRDLQQNRPFRSVTENAFLAGDQRVKDERYTVGPTIPKKKRGSDCEFFLVDPK